MRLRRPFFWESVKQMNEIKQKAARLMDNRVLRRLIFCLGAAGIALLFLSNFISFDKPDSSQPSVSDYSGKIESDLEGLLSQIEGAGKTRVLLTMENSVESVYLDNGTTKTKEIQPKIRGALILCEGGGDAVVAERLSRAVTKALDISSAKVCIEQLSE